VSLQLKASIVITFYSALTIETSALINFGLSGSKMGLFLVFVNLLVLLLSVWFALAKYQQNRIDKLKTEAWVREFVFYIWLNIVNTFQVSKQHKYPHVYMCINATFLYICSFFLFLFFYTRQTRLSGQLIIASTSSKLF
jgi:hypothetical protein